MSTGGFEDGLEDAAEPEPDRWASLKQGIHEAVLGDLVVGWVVLAEVIDSDGEKTLQTITSDEMSCWLELGMLDLRATTLRTKAMGLTRDA